MLCPFGGVETLTRFLSQGLYVPKTGVTNLVLLGAVLAATLVAGPVFCGWLCPLGAVQDWLRALARKLGAKSLNVPIRTERLLSLLRYLVLGLILWATAGSFNLVFMNADPYYALLHFWTGDVAPAALAVLSLVLAASLFVARPWCRWLCPLRGILSLVGRLSLVKMKSPSAACVSCGSCAKACPVGIDPSKGETVSDPRCIRCGDCLAACPPKLRRPSRTLAFQGLAAAALLAVFFLTPSIFGNAMGDTIHMAERSPGGRGAATAKPGGELRAQSRLSELPSALDLGLDEIYILLELPRDYDETTRLVDIEDDYENKTFAWIKARLEQAAPRSPDPAPPLSAPIEGSSPSPLPRIAGRAERSPTLYQDIVIC